MYRGSLRTNGDGGQGWRGRPRRGSGSNPGYGGDHSAQSHTDSPHTSYSSAGPGGRYQDEFGGAQASEAQGYRSHYQRPRGHRSEEYRARGHRGYRGHRGRAGHRDEGHSAGYGMRGRGGYRGHRGHRDEGESAGYGMRGHGRRLESGGEHNTGKL